MNGLDRNKLFEEAKKNLPNVTRWYWNGEKWWPLCLATPFFCGHNATKRREHWEQEQINKGLVRDVTERTKVCQEK